MIEKTKHRALDCRNVFQTTEFRVSKKSYLQENVNLLTDFRVHVC